MLLLLLDHALLCLLEFALLLLQILPDLTQGLIAFPPDLLDLVLLFLGELALDSIQFFDL